MEENLYIVYGEFECIYVVKTKNKKEAIDLAHSQFGGNQLKKNYIVKDLEKDLFKKDGFDRKIAMLNIKKVG